MNRSAWRRSITLASLTLCAAALSACYFPGGSGFSTDTHTYVSTSWQPYTITLKDTRTGQDFWSIDVPVGKQLVLTFKEGDEAAKETATPAVMEWEIMAEGELFGQLDNSIAVPAHHYRRLDTSLRPTPELPESMGGGVPSKATSSANGK